MGFAEAADFLRIFKGCLELGRYVIADRQDNSQFLIDSGMLVEERREVLFSIKPENYISGPDKHHTEHNTQVWIFGQHWQDLEIYIKIGLKEVKMGHSAVVISFHKAERKIRYPLKQGD
ncbi:hypothetical protein [Sedimentisphaera salicampi]|uniref:Toxin-antitoxin system, toxin component n=1 Tax=Sedimentisphaera salicampi TaxID=1941349 RepID=A0A1W6LMQ7_9BACT|nr:hypothetical protein [Sedimentisphaera salicampi]ARN57057.1 hypothetical protein STSP1_01452 [Sedimentisphaera salicampi]OXU14896.1 hypothetical protein SMSP1_01393 [Sedimentisphaera salicampi]